MKKTKPKLAKKTVNTKFQSKIENQKADVKALPKPTSNLAQLLAAEIAKNLSSLGQFTIRPFRKADTARKSKKDKYTDFGENPILIDSSVLIDSRIVNIVNSGFLTGTLLVPEFVLTEIQHVADSPEQVRRTRGRLGLEVVSKLRAQKANDKVRVKIIKDNPEEVKEVDHKLLFLAKQFRFKLMTVDYNLAQLSRAQGIKVMNINELAQAIKVALIPGQDLTIRISHEGKERQQGVGYLDDGTMVVVENTRDRVGQQVMVEITKVHQSPAGQLFFAKIKTP